MAKKNRKKPDARVSTDAGALKQSPFAALAGLDAPPAPVAARAPVEAAAEPKSAAGFPDKLVVRREKKGRGGKTVTRLEGVPAARLEEIAKALKRALGCGASIEGADVIVAGAQVERVAEWLREAGARRVSQSD